MHTRYRKFKSRFMMESGQGKNAAAGGKNQQPRTGGAGGRGGWKSQAKLSDRQSMLYTRFNNFYSKLQEEFERLDLANKKMETAAAAAAKSNKDDNKPKKKTNKKDLGTNNNNSNNKNKDEDKGKEEGDEQDIYMKCLKKAFFASYIQSLTKHKYRLSDTNNSFIAEGGFGKVVRVQHQGHKYAAKIISNYNMRIKSKMELAPMVSAKMISRFVNEVDIMQRVSGHKNIIGYVDSFQDQVFIEQVGDAKEVEFRCREVPDDYDEDAIEESEDTDELNFNHRRRSKTFHFKTCYIIMEYANNKTLSEYIKNEDPLGEPALAQAIGQLLNALGHLHRMNIVHRDVKLSNILLFKKDAAAAASGGAEQKKPAWKYLIKLCDFGLSSIVDDYEDGYFMKPVGTAVYMSPEILQSYYHYNQRQIDRIAPYNGFKADIWAAGVCLFYSLTGCYPLEMACKSKHSRMVALGKIFDNEGGGGGEGKQSTTNDMEKSMPMTEEQTELIRKEIIQYDTNKVSAECREVLDAMIEIDPNLRPNVDVLLKYEFFNL